MTDDQLHRICNFNSFGDIYWDEDGKFETVSSLFCFLSLINHSKYPNIEFENINDKNFEIRFVFANKLIKKGE